MLKATNAKVEATAEDELEGALFESRRKVKRRVAAAARWCRALFKVAIVAVAVAA